MSRRRPSATDRARAAARAFVRAVVVAVPVALLSGCGDDQPVVPAGAMSEASDHVGGSGQDALPLTEHDVELLASRANVAEDVVESAASSLLESDVWTRSMRGVRTIYDEAPEGVESTLVDVACVSAAGTVHTDYQLHYAIYPRVNGFSTDGVDRLTATAHELFRVLYDAGRSGRAEDRAVAALTCHALEQLRDR